MNNHNHAHGMNLKTFSELAKLGDASELEKAKLLAFYYFSKSDESDVDFSSIVAAFDELHYSKPNTSRLKRKVAKSTSFVGATPGRVKLHAKTIKELEEKYPALADSSEEVVCGDTILPRTMYSDAPTYLRKLADQVNGAYENNLFDACAVIMRRLLEVLLIQAYEKLGIESDIQDTSGNFKMLDGIAKNAKTNGKLKLSRNIKTSLDDFKLVGNFAAHKIMYTTRRGDIQSVARNFRGAVEELLYKAGHLT